MHAYRYYIYAQPSSQKALLELLQLSPPCCRGDGGPSYATTSVETSADSTHSMSPPQQPELEPGACAVTPPQQTLLDAPAIMYTVDDHTAAMPAAAATTTAAPTAGPSAGFAAPDPMETPCSTLLWAKQYITTGSRC